MKFSLGDFKKKTSELEYENYLLTRLINYMISEEVIGKSLINCLHGVSLIYCLNILCMMI